MLAIDFQQTQPKAAFPKFTDYKAAFPKSPEALFKQNDSQAPLRIISPSSDSSTAWEVGETRVWGFGGGGRGHDIVFRNRHP